MESGLSWEQKTVVGELLQGVEFAKQLRVQLSNAASSHETKELLVQRILASFEKALLIQNWSGGGGSSSSTMVTLQQQQQQPPSVAANSGSGSGVLPESPISINGNSPPRNEKYCFKERQDNTSNNSRDVSKKRKLTPSWTEQVKIGYDGGLEGTHDDGYSWRKYGQKDILAAKYPRSYYRCTYRNTQDCWATKQMQRSDDDPTVFDITYRGKHTCSSANRSAGSPKKQEKKTNTDNATANTNSNYQPQQQSSEQMLLNLRQCLRVNTNTEELNKETPSSFSFPSISFGCVKAGNASLSTLMLDNNNSSPPYISPAQHESKYFSNFGGINHHAYRSESDLTEMISTNNSVSNSPIPDLDFSADIDHNFLFDNSEFFT
ncbi:hypothetical protein ACFE04_015797 [Oxalis oulophora]